MRRAAGQVAREAHRVLHLLLGLAILLLLGTGVLAFRLSQGPIALPWLAQTIEEQVNAPGPDGTPATSLLEIGEASIGWRGWGQGGLTPVELRLSRVQLRGADGRMGMSLPDAAVTLSLPWLLRGEVAPQRVELEQPTLLLRRAADGEISVLLGSGGAAEAPASADTDPATASPTTDPATASPTTDPATASPATDPATAATGADPMLAELMRAPSDESPLGALRLVRLRGGRVVVEDAALGLTWVLADADLMLRRRTGGGIEGHATAMLLLGSERVVVTASAEVSAADLAGGPAQIAFRLLLPGLRPALLAATAPQLAPLAGLDAAVDLEVSGSLDSHGTLRHLQATVAAGPGAIDLGPGRRVAIARFDLALEATPDRIGISRASLLLDGPAPPTLSLTGQALRSDGTWRGAATLSLDAVRIADLGRYWPEALAANTRAWLVENLTAGVARGGQWQITGEAGADLSAPRLTALDGTLSVQDATVHWLRPVPPAEGASGTVSFGLREISMQVSGGRQSGGQVRLRDGTVRFLLPPQGQETAEMTFNMAGPIPDALAVVKHPRLHLFDRQPFPLQDPRGQMEGQVELAFPLLAELPVEQLRLRVQARLRQIRLSDLLLGRALEAAQVDLTVTNAGLTASSRAARLGGITGQLNVELDFRSGPATQLVRRETVRASTDVRTLDALGLAIPELADGPVGLDITMETRRNGQGRATIRADLGQARMMIDPLSWSKPAGQPAQAEIVLRLDDDKLQAIDSFQVRAPSLRVNGRAAFTGGARLQQVTITEAAIEDSRFTAEALPPPSPGAPWAVTMRGAVLDLQRSFAEDPVTGGPDAASADPSGPSFAATARFDRVLLGPARQLEAVRARVRVDGHGVVRAGDLAGFAGPQGSFEAVINPAGAGRSLRLTAQDAGALLGRFDVLRDLRGGQLSVQANYADNRPGAALTGTAEMQDFSVQNAPSFAKLLQAMTLYGLVEAVSGPGLGFAQLVAPFTLTPGVLALRDARAFSASLGVTAKGTINRRTRAMAIEGTIVPAYFFNSLLGNIPILGRLFSPEAGGGLFAATFQLNGPAEDPQVSVNALAALTPGFLRGLFQIGPAR